MFIPKKKELHEKMQWCIKLSETQSLNRNNTVNLSFTNIWNRLDVFVWSIDSDFFYSHTFMTITIFKVAGEIFTFFT